MLSFLRMLVGCWHDWGRYERCTIQYIDGHIDHNGQRRFCKKCGVKQVRC